METNKITQERYDEIYQEALFEKVHEIIDQQRDWLEEIKDLGFEKLPNIGITLNNKIVELERNFKYTGLSMYSHLHEDYGPMKLTFVADSTVGVATLDDLLDICKRGVNQITEFHKRLDSIISGKKGVLQKLKIAFRLLRYDDFYFTKEEAEELTEPLKEYERINTELFNYNLKDNAVDGVIKELIRKGYSKETAVGILEEEIIPDLEKLGLENSVVPLKLKLEKVYKLAEEEISEPTEESGQQTETEQIVERPTTEKGNKIELYNSPAKKRENRRFFF